MTSWYANPGPSTATISDLDGGVCAVTGVRAAGVAVGLKPSGSPDLALVDAGSSVTAAAVQTRNQVKAAPVRVTDRHVANGRARAVLLNAGSANVCTGEAGMRLAQESAAAVAAALGCPIEDVLLCSTGVIGVPIPPQPLLGGIPSVVERLSPSGGADAAAAIITTDTVPKQVAVRVEDGRGACVIGGMAKGAGMIAPEMATMLCVLTTDADLAHAQMDDVLRRVVARTFGRITVDGCMSTNDAVILLATGAADRPVTPEAFEEGLLAVCGRLAEWLVRDGEGVEHVVHVRVVGAASDADADGVARAVASSLLFKTAVAGGDPNWGRVLAAMGAGRVRFDPDRVTVAFGDVTVCRDGVAAEFDRSAAAKALDGPDVLVTIDLGAGEGAGGVLTCDLTHAYVTINAEYTT